MADKEQSEGSEQQTNNDAATATQERPAPAKSPKRTPPKQLPPYKVLLHNDDVNDFDYVVKSVVSLTHLQTEDAVLRTIEAHETGVSLLLVTHKERAELYQEQFQSMKLTTTIEPAE